MEKIKIAFSPCPNDTFMFYALVNKKIPTYDLEFNFIIDDVESLNKLAYSADIDVSKLSYHVFGHVLEYYQMLTSGSALGYKNGPLLVSKKKINLDEINNITIAIPGMNTTANLLFSIAFPDANNKKEYLFSDIEDLILDEKIDAGLLIHEKRFTFEKKGLHKIIDLGEYWENLTSLPIPLGGIAVKRSMDDEIKRKVNKIVKESIEYAFKNKMECLEFIKEYSQEKDEEIIWQHIDLYVNQFSIDVGIEGKNAVTELFKLSSEKGILKLKENTFFITI